MRNAHLSYSRISRFAQCPLAYRFHYVDRRKSTPGPALGFGTLVHAVLEDLVREHMEDERQGPLCLDRAKALYAAHFARGTLTEPGTFEEGWSLVRRFVREEGVLDHRDLLAVEQEFRLPVGRFTVLGFIDRVDLAGDRTARILDYKTNRLLFTEEELHTSLQMSLYELAVRQLWPWVEHVEMAFVMLRHGVRQETRRTPEQLDAALAYIEAMGERMEVATDFPPRLNPNCGYCDHRAHCPTYQEVLEGSLPAAREMSEDPGLTAAHWHEVSSAARILYGRKRELERRLQPHLEHTDTIETPERSYRLLPMREHRYPAARLLPHLQRLTGRPERELVERLCIIDRDALDTFLADHGRDLTPARQRLLRAEVESHAEVVTTQRLIAQEHKS